MKKFEKAFEELKKQHFPVNEYVVTGAACLAVHNLRDTVKIDILPTKEFWNELVFRYPVTQIDNVSKIDLPFLEILKIDNTEWSLEKSLDIKDIIQMAEHIEGVNFAHLDYVKSVKLKMARPKDLIDIELIDEYLGLHTVV